MQIEESRKLLFSDTLVPDIFVMEYMPSLDGLAVKLYLYGLFAARTRRTLSEGEVARRLGVDPEPLKEALAALVAAGLVRPRERGFEILDIKEIEVEKFYRPKSASTPEEAHEAARIHPQREKLLSDISKTFFQGLMSPSWYGEIDSWYDRYHFEPEVVYALFQECARRSKLDSRFYIARVAENWSQRGIRTFADLNAYFASREKVASVSRKIGRKLRRTMTEYDDQDVTRWVEGLGYEFEVIDLALRRASRSARGSLQVVGRILEEWHAAGLKTPDEVEAYEAARPEARRHPGSGRVPVNAGNFDQPARSEQEWRDLYDDPARMQGAAGDTDESGGIRAAGDDDDAGTSDEGPRPRRQDPMDGQLGLFDLVGDQEAIP